MNDAPTPSAPPSLTLVGLTDQGRIRHRNEDALEVDPAAGILVVADGMGGHPGGDVASAVAASHVLAALRRLDGAAGPTSVGDAMARIVVDAHHAIRARGADEPDLVGMGTTLTAFRANLAGGTWTVVHVGDSRAYLLRHGSFRQLTRDDTWVQKRIDAATLTREEARRHPFGHILIQCLGLDAVPEPQVLTGHIQAGDAFLLCTDGLVGMVDDEPVADALRAHLHRPQGHPDPKGAADALVKMANDRGGYDNITVGLVLVS